MLLGHRVLGPVQAVEDQVAEKRKPDLTRERKFLFPSAIGEEQAGRRHPRVPRSMYLRNSMNPSVPRMTVRPSPQVRSPDGVSQSTRK